MLRCQPDPNPNPPILITYLSCFHFIFQPQITMPTMQSEMTILVTMPHAGTVSAEALAMARMCVPKFSAFLVPCRCALPSMNPSVLITAKPTRMSA